MTKHKIVIDSRIVKRKHISWKTKCAAAVLDAMMIRERSGLDSERWYRAAQEMTEDQFLSLFQWDHNILHETGHINRDRYWNLTPTLIQAHREKTKKDAKIIAKSRRIRKAAADFLALKPKGMETALDLSEPMWRKMQSRGFDKRLRKKMDGTVVKR